MSGTGPAEGQDAVANRELWIRVNAEYTGEQAVRAWAAEDIAWGVFNVPERQLGVLGEVDGLDVVELGCGTAYFSAWLARRGARPVGVDLTADQLATARRCQERCGASLWCDPARWVPEAARLLRPGGRLVFHTTSVLVTLCLPEAAGHAGRELLRPQRRVYRLDVPGRGVEFHPGHGEWIQVLRAAGFAVDALHELYAPPGASTHPYYVLATAEWAQRWPVEEVWVAHLTA